MALSSLDILLFNCYNTIMKQARLDQLSDGIFAIVMTVLIFEIRVPEYFGIVSDRTLINYLISMYPVLLSYVLSFSLLFTYWRSHHLTASVFAKNIDVPFSNINGFFFFFVALVPFSAHFLGRYIDSKTAIIFFAINIIMIGLSLYKMRRYAIKSKTIENMPFTKTENEHAMAHILFPVISAIIAIAVSFVSTEIAIFFFTIAILFNLSKNGTKYMFYIVDKFRASQKEELV